MKLLYRGETHLAEDKGQDWALVICNRALLPPFTWQPASDDAKLTCRGCRALERRERRG